MGVEDEGGTQRAEQAREESGPQPVAEQNQIEDQGHGEQRERNLRQPKRLKLRAHRVHGGGEEGRVTRRARRTGISLAPGDRARRRDVLPLVAVQLRRRPDGEDGGHAQPPREQEQQPESVDRGPPWKSC